METFVIALVVVSAIIHAFWNFLIKKARDKQVFVWLLQLFSLLFFLPVFAYFFIKEGIKSSIGIYISIASGFFIFLYLYFLSKSYDKGDLSHVYPIIRSAPALVLIFAIVFLKEHVSALGFLGISFVFVGAYTINMKKISFLELLEPPRLIAKDRTTQFAFLTLIFVVAYTIADKVGVGYIHPFIYIYFIYFFSFLFFSAYILFSKSKNLISAEWNLNKKNILMSGFLAIFGYSLILLAFTSERVSYVVALRQLSIIFAFILSSYFLNEKNKAIRFSAAALIFIGAFFISIAQ